MKERDTEILERENEVINISEKILGLPHCIPSITADSRLGGLMNIRLRLPENFKNFINTEYYYNGRSIIHFTNINSAISILKSCKFRLYNLYYKNDKNEFIFASKILENFYNPTELYSFDLIKEIEEVKYNTFILSATSKEKIDEFWKKDYSKKGNGIGLEFSFFNDPNNWTNFYLSSIKYGKLEKFSLLREKFSELENINRNISYKINLNQIIPFYKESCWSDENEVRLMTSFPKVNNIDIYKDTGDNKIKFINLPIHSKFETSINSKIPIMKIEKIYLGPNILNNDAKMIKSLVNENFTDQIEIINYVA